MIDVGNNFVGIYQVINRNKIEPYPKLVPKRKLCHQTEKDNDKDNGKIEVSKGLICH